MSYRRTLDLEAARIRRSDAVDAFAAAAATLADLRRQNSPNPVEMIVAESRVETARKRFWATDAELRALLPDEAAVG